MSFFNSRHSTLEIHNWLMAITFSFFLHKLISIQYFNFIVFYQTWLGSDSFYCQCYPYLYRQKKSVCFLNEGFFLSFHGHQLSMTNNQSFYLFQRYLYCPSHSRRYCAIFFLKGHTIVLSCLLVKVYYVLGKCVLSGPFLLLIFHYETYWEEEKKKSSVWGEAPQPQPHPHSRTLCCCGGQSIRAFALTRMVALFY